MPLKKYLGHFSILTQANISTKVKTPLHKQIIHSKNPYFHWYFYQHISLYALGRPKWILDIFWPLNQHCKLKNQRNWIKQVLTLKFWSVINWIFVQWTKKLTIFTHVTKRGLSSDHLPTSSCQRCYWMTH